jgi:hypothetical protein
MKNLVEKQSTRFQNKTYLKKNLTRGNMVEKLRKQYLGKGKINKKEKNSF